MAAGGKMVWTGRVISILASLVFIMSGFMKLKGGPQVTEGMGHLGLAESMLVPLAILELTCVAVYLIPATSVLGAVLLTGYMGGAICTHWREATYSSDRSSSGSSSGSVCTFVSHGCGRCFP